jgi:hypothetical protein
MGHIREPVDNLIDTSHTHIQRCRAHLSDRMRLPHASKRLLLRALLLVVFFCALQLAASQGMHLIGLFDLGRTQFAPLSAANAANQTKLPPSRRAGANVVGATPLTASNGRRSASPVRAIKASAATTHGPYKDLTPSDPITLFGKPGLRHIRGIGYQPVSAHNELKRQWNSFSNSLAWAVARRRQSVSLHCCLQLCCSPPTKHTFAKRKAKAKRMVILSSRNWKSWIFTAQTFVGCTSVICL